MRCDGTEAIISVGKSVGKSNVATKVNIYLNYNKNNNNKFSFKKIYSIKYSLQGALIKQ